MDCKVQAHIDQNFADYLKARYPSKQLVRAGIYPFEVPGTFFLAGGDQTKNFGLKLAEYFQRKFVEHQSPAIVEIFNRDRWPGKREEFFAGNYEALNMARNAGYDLVIVGFMEDPKDDQTFVIHSKVIDTSNNMTIWYGTATVVAHGREYQKNLARFHLASERPDLFYVQERADMAAQCSVDAIMAPRAPGE